MYDGYTTLKEYIGFVNTENLLPAESVQLTTTLLIPNSLRPVEGRRKLEGRIFYYWLLTL
jgi:hypothetical protein